MRSHTGGRRSEFERTPNYLASSAAHTQPERHFPTYVHPGPSMEGLPPSSLMSVLERVFWDGFTAALVLSSGGRLSISVPTTAGYGTCSRARRPLALWLRHSWQLKRLSAPTDACHRSRHLSSSKPSLPSKRAFTAMMYSGALEIARSGPQKPALLCTRRPSALCHGRLRLVWVCLPRSNHPDSARWRADFLCPRLLSSVAITSPQSVEDDADEK